MWGGGKGSVEERQKEPTQTLRKHAQTIQTEAACPRNLAARRQPRSVAHLVSDFSKMFTFPRSRKHCQDETEERRGCVWIPAYIDLCRSLLLREDSCFSSDPRSHFLGCLWRKQRAAAANEIIAVAAAVLRISRFKRQRKSTTEGLFKAGWGYSAFLQTDLNSLSVTQLPSCVSSFQMFSVSSFTPVDSQDKSEGLGSGDCSIWSLLCCRRRFYKGLIWLTFKVCLWGAT